MACFKALIAICNKGDDLYRIYEEKINKDEAIIGNDGLNLVEGSSRVPEILHLANSVERKLDGITNYFVSRHNNGYGEGLNSRIGKIVRDSRGFTNNDYMILG
ncbi:MAG: transposase [Candidatus Gracilibacteria bacterium]|nr:transposase [Candidatus Gracilibacteria bacterium]MDQ7023882.1 transposase [Candidatus Gracilibacteria bacterium]